MYVPYVCMYVCTYIYFWMHESIVVDTCLFKVELPYKTLFMTLSKDVIGLLAVKTELLTYSWEKDINDNLLNSADNHSVFIWSPYN